MQDLKVFIFFREPISKLSKHHRVLCLPTDTEMHKEASLPRLDGTLFIKTKQNKRISVGGPPNVHQVQEVDMTLSQYWEISRME